MLNWPFFIAKRFITKEQQSKSKSVFFLAILSVSLSVSVMILAFATVRGFRDEIKHKISLVHGDFVLDATSNVENGDPQPFHDSLEQSILKLKSLKGIKKIILSSSKSSIIKSEEEIEGIIAKGIQRNDLKGYLGDFVLQSDLNENEFWVGLSTVLAKRLKVKLGDDLKLVFFVQDSTGNTRPRARKLTITTIFETGIERVDANMVLLDQSVVKMMLPANYGYTQAEIWLNQNASLKDVKKEIATNLNFQALRLNTAEEYNRQIFDWLSILDLNVIILLLLITVVAITATCTTLLILITEKTSFIGLMITLGARNNYIQRIFIYQASMIAFIGLMLGNIMALSLCYFQNRFKFLTLNQEVYFIKYVAMKVNLSEVVLVNIGAFILIYLSLYLPARYIRKMNPITAIKFK